MACRGCFATLPPAEAPERGRGARIEEWEKTAHGGREVPRDRFPICPSPPPLAIPSPTAIYFALALSAYHTIIVLFMSFLGTLALSASPPLWPAFHPGCQSTLLPLPPGNLRKLAI